MSEQTPYRPYGTAVYRRLLDAQLSPGRAEGELIDDFHHFRAWITHDGERVTGAGGAAPRHPWATCAEAVGPLRALVGAPLARLGSMRAPAAYTDRRRQCTHLFDAATLALARVARDAGDVSYRIAVPDAIDGRTRAELCRDGEALLLWDIRDRVIETPGPFAGRRLGAGLADWAESELDASLAEAVLVLQRACTIAGGRRMDLEAYPGAAAVQPNPMGQCHTYQPGTVERGARMRGSVRDLTDVEDLRAASLAEP